MPLNKGFLLASRPQGVATESNFRFFERDIGEPGPGKVLVRNLWLSLDPYMRGRMDESRSYAASQALDEPMIGGTAGEVVASNSPDFKAGDKVVSNNGGWQLYAIQNPAMLRKVDDSKVPLQAFVGPLGMPGVTAWVGVNRFIQPKAGETVVCSAATGAVGTVVGQIAKAKGARTVGIAGGPEKCRFAVEELGYDLCVDHKAADFAQQLAAATPNGVDGLFENVGGQPFALTIARMNDFGRIAICGLIASYEGAETTSLSDMRLVLTAPPDDARLHRERLSAGLAGRARRTDWARLHRQAQMARDDRARHRERAVRLPRHAQGQEFRQAARQAHLTSRFTRRTGSGICRL